MSTQSRRLGRQVRRAFQVRRWPLRRKIAFGAWIPVVVVALALLTGPNRAGSAPKAVVVPKVFIPTTATTVALPLTTPTNPRTDIGLWIQGKGRRRKMTIGGSTSLVDSQAQLRLKSHYLHLARQQADRRARAAAKGAPLTLPGSTPTTKF